MDKQLSILLVEDDEHIRRILQYNLKLDGFNVIVAENGAAALEFAAEHIPDLILLDWMMPGMNGLEVLSKLKQNPKTENITVFMLTAKGMMKDVGQALYEGADDYLTKPFDPAQLCSTIRAKLQQCAKADPSRQP